MQCQKLSSAERLFFSDIQLIMLDRGLPEDSDEVKCKSSTIINFGEQIYLYIERKRTLNYAIVQHLVQNHLLEVLIIGAKTYEESIKYKLTAEITVDGMANESDIVGALFGQTEGLLGEEMDFKQLQKAGRIGRIVLRIKRSKGKTVGTIEVPSSLSKTETAIIAATLETVDRVGSNEAKVRLVSIEDVRKEKRSTIAKRAAEIMKSWSPEPEIENLIETVEKTARVLKPIKYGPDALTAGPDLLNAESIILVEGRADVLNLLKAHITNAVEVRGTNIPSSLKNLCKRKSVTVFLDGDGGGDQILKNLLSQGISIDFVARAPKNKEVEDLDKKQLLKALENKVRLEDAGFLHYDDKISDFQRSKHGKRRRKASSLVTKKESKVAKVKVEPPEQKPSKRLSEMKLKKSSGQKTVAKLKKPKISSGKFTKSYSKGKGQRKLPRYSKRSSSEPRRRTARKVIVHTVPRPLISMIRKIKHSLRTVFLDENYNPIQTVPTAQAYEYLTSLDKVHSVLIDGVISPRMIEAARERNATYLLGAIMSDQIDHSVLESLTNDGLVYASFQKIKQYI
ncbi:MAG: DNA primase [Methanobacteriota archaeon]|nr:MAG: DNA primase [Euryarchaeota archaeon]